MLGSTLVSIIRTRQVLDGNTSKPVMRWKNKQTDLSKKLNRQRKILGR